MAGSNSHLFLYVSKLFSLLCFCEIKSWVHVSKHLCSGHVSNGERREWVGLGEGTSEEQRGAPQEFRAASTLRTVPPELLASLWRELRAREVGLRPTRCLRSSS